MRFHCAGLTRNARSGDVRQGLAATGEKIASSTTDEAARANPRNALQRTAQDSMWRPYDSFIKNSFFANVASKTQHELAHHADSASFCPKNACGGNVLSRSGCTV